MPLLTLRSPAKINLHLRVGQPDASGFHPLRSWMITTTLYDDLTFSTRDGPGGIAFTCDEPVIPADGRNLVVRAAHVVLGDQPPAVAIQLSKRIPFGAGLGGGSGNAATTLLGLNRLLSLGKSPGELAMIAATLGSDVPFFLGPPSAIATGRGEVLEATPPPRARHAVLVLPPFTVSTAAAYQKLDAMRPNAPTETLSAFDAVAWAELPAAELLEKVANDLEPPAFALVPQLQVLRDELEARLARRFPMSGSGSTLFTLFDEAKSATHTAAEIERIRGIRAISVELGKPSGFSA